MAHLEPDPNMVEAFREGSDIHAATAAKIWAREDIKEVTDAQRKKQNCQLRHHSLKYDSVLPNA